MLRLHRPPRLHKRPFDRYSCAKCFPPPGDEKRVEASSEPSSAGAEGGVGRGAEFGQVAEILRACVSPGAGQHDASMVSRH